MLAGSPGSGKHTRWDCPTAMAQLCIDSVACLSPPNGPRKWLQDCIWTDIACVLQRVLPATTYWHWTMPTACGAPAQQAFAELLIEHFKSKVCTLLTATLYPASPHNPQPLLRSAGPANRRCVCIDGEKTELSGGCRWLCRCRRTYHHGSDRSFSMLLNINAKTRYAERSAGPPCCLMEAHLAGGRTG